MMIEEFEKLVGKTVKAEEYKVIELVYTWHPAISNTTGKKQMADLYTNFGMSVIKGMVPVAQKMSEIDNERRKLQAKMDMLKEREEMLKEGDLQLEDAIVIVNREYMKAETPEKFEVVMKNLEMDAEIKNMARRIADV